MMSSNVITQYVTPTNNCIVQTYVTSKRLDKQILKYDTLISCLHLDTETHNCSDGSTVVESYSR